MNEEVGSFSSEAGSSRKRVDNEGLLYFQVEDIRFQDLFDWSGHLMQTGKKNGLLTGSEWLLTNEDSRFAKSRLHPSPSSSSSTIRRGGTASVNMREVALFRCGDTVYAIQERCPHAGGPLHVGDLEDLGGSKLCVRCPYHGWKFDLRTGECRFPGRSAQQRAEVFPVRVNRNPDDLWVGFSAFSDIYFKQPLL